MARRLDAPDDPKVVVVNPDEGVTPDAFRDWLRRVQRSEPLELPVSAAETLDAERAARGET